MSAAESAQPRVRRYASQFPRSPPQIGQACDDRTLLGESGYAGHCSFGLFLVENGRNQVRRHRLEMRRFHRITGATLRKRTNGSRVAEQLGERDLGVNNGEIAARLDIVNAATTAAEVAADIPLELSGRAVCDLHARLHQNRFALLNP